MIGPKNQYSCPHSWMNEMKGAHRDSVNMGPEFCVTALGSSPNLKLDSGAFLPQMHFTVFVLITGS